MHSRSNDKIGSLIRFFCNKGQVVTARGAVVRKTRDRMINNRDFICQDESERYEE